MTAVWVFLCSLPPAWGHSIRQRLRRVSNCVVYFVVYAFWRPSRRDQIKAAKKPASPEGSGLTSRCGAKGIRTPDLYNAIVALYQLSYGPKIQRRRFSSNNASDRRIGSKGPQVDPTPLLHVKSRRMGRGCSKIIPYSRDDRWNRGSNHSKSYVFLTRTSNYGALLAPCVELSPSLRSLDVRVAVSKGGRLEFPRPAGKVNACYIFRQNSASNGACFQTCTGNFHLDVKFHLDPTISSPLVCFYRLRWSAGRRVHKIVRQVMRASVRHRNARMSC